MLTDQEKQFILNLLSQVSFKVGQSDQIKMAEIIATKLQKPVKEDSKKK